jgi:hypothetical protein
MSNYNSWQYQTHVEPVSTEPERTQVDKWYQPASIPSRNWATRAAFSLAAVIGPHFVGPLEPIVQAEELTLDKWESRVSQPVFKRKNYNWLTGGAVDPSQPIPRLDSWFAPTSQPTRKVPYRLGETVRPILPVVPPIQPPQAQPAFKVKQRTSDTGFLNFEPVAPEVITLDKWFSQLPEPQRRRRTPEGSVVQPIVPIVPAALPPLVQPAFKTKRVDSQFGFLNFEPVAPAPPETVTVDKWLSPATLPIYRISAHATYQSLFYHATPIPTVTPDAPTVLVRGQKRIVVVDRRIRRVKKVVRRAVRAAEKVMQPEAPYSDELREKAEELLTLQSELSSVQSDIEALKSELEQTALHERRRREEEAQRLVEEQIRRHQFLEALSRKILEMEEEEDLVVLLMMHE